MAVEVYVTIASQKGKSRYSWLPSFLNFMFRALGCGLQGWAVPKIRGIGSSLIGKHKKASQCHRTSHTFTSRKPTLEYTMRPYE